MSIRACGRAARASFAVALALAALSACTTRPYSGTLPSGVRPLARRWDIGAAGTFAVAPGGRRVAVVTAGSLRVYEIGGATLPARPTAERAPFAGAVALAWSADGASLAIARNLAKDAEVEVVDARLRTQRRARLVGRVSDVAWLADKRLLVAVQRARTYSFGGHIRGLLYDWRPPAKPVATQLWETELRRGRRRMWAWLDRLFVLAVSPTRDELAYTRLRDPPNVEAYVAVTVRRLGSGASREVARVRPGATALAYGADGERVLYSDGTTVRSRATWGAGPARSYAAVARRISCSPGGRYLVLGAALFAGSARLATFAQGSVGRLAGGRLFVAAAGRLHVYAGFSDARSAARTPDVRDKLSALRDWRAKRLITAGEYDVQRAKLLGLAPK